MHNTKMTMIRTLLLTIFTAVLLSGCSIWGQRTGEEALYSTLAVDENFEIRLYEPLIIAQTAVEGPYLAATRTGYQRLTDYVSGYNLANQTVSVNPPIILGEGAKKPKIELTTPYYEEYLDGVWLTSVAMPEAYTLQTLPKPVDGSITFKVLPRLKVAVISYMGYRSERMIQKKTELLLQWLAQNNITPTSSARSVIYDTPWTIPMLRRHEIHINVP
ncbi:MAG: heme-binding protein [Proteobacteria bacterium]|nr:MAG: heme-binding protein [Pseudomonadota bacterium]